MRRVSFAELSWGVRIVLGLASFNLWMSFEEFVINRSNLWRYLPGYKSASGCIWDLLVGVGIAAAMWWLSARPVSERQTR
jgi:hypothetical protein